MPEKPAPWQSRDWGRVTEPGVGFEGGTVLARWPEGDQKLERARGNGEQTAGARNRVYESQPPPGQ